jgi:hypothetical protein
MVMTKAEKPKLVNPVNMLILARKGLLSEKV